ncbi:MAG: hypothetical protein AAFZ38_09440 [Myxococcota bacterium]
MPIARSISRNNDRGVQVDGLYVGWGEDDPESILSVYVVCTTIPKELCERLTTWSFSERSTTNSGPSASHGNRMYAPFAKGSGLRFRMEPEQLELSTATAS